MVQHADPGLRAERVYPLPLLAIGDLNVTQSLIGIVGESGQHSAEPAHKSVCGRAPVQVGAVDDVTAIAVVGGEEVDRQVGVRDVEWRLQGGEHGVTVGRRLHDLPGGQRFPHVHHDTEERIARQRAHRANRVDDLIEGKILVGVCPQRGLTCLAQQVAQRGVTPQVVAQHHDVDEEADQLIELGFGAAGHRSAQRNVIALTGLVQCHRDRGLQQHEFGHAQLLAEVGEPGADCRRRH